jgi:hypothetical protein
MNRCDVARIAARPYGNSAAARLQTIKALEIRVWRADVVSRIFNCDDPTSGLAAEGLLMHSAQR